MEAGGACAGLLFRNLIQNAITGEFILITI